MLIRALLEHALVVLYSDHVGCFVMNLSMLGCTGPALTAVDLAGVPINGSIDVGPAGSYGDLYGWSKLLLCFQMLLGRLELLVPLALLTPGFWKR